MIDLFFSNPRKKNGFTIVELIIVFSIIAILSSIGVVASVNYSRAQSLEAATQDLKTILNQAKSYAQSQYKPPECNNNALEKFRLELDRSDNEYTLWVVCSGLQTIVQSQLPSDVSFDLTGTTSDYFEFPILTGGIIADGPSPWYIRLNGAGGRYKIITLEQNGIIK